MTWILCTSGAAVLKAGRNANSTITISGAALTAWCDQAEAQINTATRRDWITEVASTKTNFAGILSDLCSDIIAIKIINYDMSGYTSKLEATTMLDVLRDNMIRNLEILKEKDKITGVVY